jgi:predicted AlkP superfamily pyrophosphatase or phosphodiesterase
LPSLISFLSADFIKFVRMVRLRFIIALFSAALFIFYCGCAKDPVIYKHATRNVVLVIVDGARYTETWGLPGRTHIPHRSSFLNQGVMCTAMYNNGYTFTNAGHTALTTGVYQNINNGGTEYPANPSVFQYYLKKYKGSSTDAWVVATKDKLAVLSDCTNPVWQGKYRPSTDCGNAGLGTGYREDSVTFDHVKNILNVSHPRLMLVNFKQPDAAGHAADSTAYLQGIIDTDEYIYRIWEQLQSDPFYKDQTTLIVTNDHGRHTAGHLDGYVSHTDNCEGCRHIEFFAMGPDFKSNYTSTVPYNQIDINATLAELLDVQMPTAKGKVMKEFFK